MPSRSLHFWINDGLTAVFLAIDMEIRREIHEGALGHVEHALLSMAAAFGRAVLPALIYLNLKHDSVRPQGWTAPTVCVQPLPELAVSQVGVCNQPLTLATERCSVVAMRAGRATPWRAPRSDRAPLHQSPAATHGSLCAWDFEKDGQEL